MSKKKIINPFYYLNTDNLYPRVLRGSRDYVIMYFARAAMRQKSPWSSSRSFSFRIELQLK